MKDELFGEQHEESQFGLFGIEHQKQMDGMKESIRRETIQIMCSLQLINKPELKLTKDQAKVMVENAKTLVNVLIEQDLV